ncbi:ABC transporter transmembrane domain-containing protein [Shewanella sp. 1_MG-2023]|uniref:ABC transporter transmembrane domain-containing protein n=1 Tax=unclassified Shewanella TaxID=196818 RepID=UPI0026E2D139|nr:MULTISPECIES: ABC transporter transmembrane domain-containing protein [unclassified Shewanella]MDO6611226.1 ABC transporter transmembrane domain-containing protein [Shewanella sp. 7_MG-2023]MDO6770897.1 ABC transporter transmembrane domain-containing protein [Shewanella sp. 2_MG-2023]MDO6794716.1 ABC transporter transmembrane domain-containing protein [Shewanella sp. 1_MG-2023]
MRENFRLFSRNKAFPELLLSSTFINLLSLALPFTMLQIYDRILPNQGYGTATILVSGVAIAILLELVLRYGRSWLLAASAANFELETTTDVVSKLMKADYNHVEAMGTGRIANGLASIASMRELYSGQAIVALMDFPFVLIFLALVAYIGGPLVFIPIAVWLVVGALVFYIGKKLATATHALALSDAERTRMLILVLSGLTTAKALSLEDRLSGIYNNINHQRLESQQQVDWLSAKLQEVIQGAAQGTTLILVMLGCLEVLNGSLTTGGLAACSILAGRAVAPLSAIISLRSRLVSAQTAMSHVNDLTQLPEESFQGTKIYQQKLPLGPIHFDNISSKNLGTAITHFSHHIQANSLVTLQSNPLSHASHLLSIIAGFQQVSAGQVTIDNIAIHQHDSKEFRQSITYVAPWPTLFAGSLLENMTMFRAEFEPQAMAIADSLGLTSKIAELPNGYQTMVGDSDSQMLNKGAIKLIAIVRAIVQKPSIILLDEPMISLDADAQGRLLALLQQLKQQMTIVAASHFTELASLSDECIEINGVAHREMDKSTTTKAAQEVSS